MKNSTKNIIQAFIFLAVIAGFIGFSVFLKKNSAELDAELKKNVVTCNYVGTVTEVPCALLSKTVKPISSYEKCRVQLDTQEKINLPNGLLVIKGDRLTYCSNSMPDKFDNYYTVE